MYYFNNNRLSFEERLIEEVRCYDILYNPSSVDYKNILVKESVWRDISQRLGVSEEKAKKKWKNLRDVYKRLQRRSGSDAPVHCKWKFLKQMRFLDSVNRNTIGNPNEVREVSSPETVGDPFEVLSREHSSSPLPPKRRSHEDVQEQFFKLLENASQQLDEACTSTSSTTRLFHALSTRVENTGLTDDELAIVELAATECVINKIQEIKNIRQFRSHHLFT